MRRYGDTAALDADFERYCKELAEAFLPGVSFANEELAELPPMSVLQSILDQDPSNYRAQRLLVQRAMMSKDWAAGLAAAQRLAELYPNDAESGGALEAVATCARELGETSIEQAALENIVAVSSDNTSALQRLIELAREGEQWQNMLDYSQQFLAVQPLATIGHESLIEAARRLRAPELSADSLRALMEMQPVDPAQFELRAGRCAVGRW